MYHRTRLQYKLLKVFAFAFCIVLPPLWVNLASAATVTINSSSTLKGYGTINGAINASLSASIYNAYTISSGENYTLIDNDGADAVSGIFTGLTEGSIFSLGGKNLSISYIGGDGNYVVLKAPSDQVMSFSGLSDKTYGDADFSVSATATSGLTVTFASCTTSVCTVSGSSLSIVAPGSCSITVAQAGDTNYNAGKLK